MTNPSRCFDGGSQVFGNDFGSFEEAESRPIVARSAGQRRSADVGQPTFIVARSRRVPRSAHLRYAEDVPPSSPMASRSEQDLEDGSGEAPLD